MTDGIRGRSPHFWWKLGKVGRRWVDGYKYQTQGEWRPLFLGIVRTGAGSYC